MKKLINLVLTLSLCLSLFTGCSSLNADSNTQITHEKITSDEAKSIMDSGESYILLDVRTQEEYDTEHIEGAILIPDYEIKTTAESTLTDKDALILVYCRSGRRSNNAASELATLGYTNVKDFGGIIDWEYSTVTK